MWRYYGLAVLIIVLDQWTKFLVIQKMEIYETIPVMDGILSFTSHRNTGAAWGVLQDQMIFFYIVTIVVVAVIVYYMQTYAREHALFAIGLGLILGGAVGNFIDRLVHQEVVDFIDVMIFTYDFPIFNVADSALTIGVIFALIATFWEDHSKKKGKDNA